MPCDCATSDVTSVVLLLLLLLLGCSALMTQVVSEPAYSDIMRSLMLCNEGEMELYLRNPASFNIPTGDRTTAHGAPPAVPLAPEGTVMPSCQPEQISCSAPQATLRLRLSTCSGHQALPHP